MHRACHARNVVSTCLRVHTLTYVQTHGEEGESVQRGRGGREGMGRQGGEGDAQPPWSRSLSPPASVITEASQLVFPCPSLSHFQSIFNTAVARVILIKHVSPCHRSAQNPLGIPMSRRGRANSSPWLSRLSLCSPYLPELLLLSLVLPPLLAIPASWLFLT